MPSKSISGTYAAGYTLTGAYSALTIGTAGSIGGFGIVGGATAGYAIVNLGRVAASATGASGVKLQAGGTITNGSTSNNAALIAGGKGTIWRAMLGGIRLGALDHLFIARLQTQGRFQDVGPDGVMHHVAVHMLAQ